MKRFELVGWDSFESDPDCCHYVISRHDTLKEASLAFSLRAKLRNSQDDDIFIYDNEGGKTVQKLGGTDLYWKGEGEPDRNQIFELRSGDKAKAPLKWQK